MIEDPQHAPKEEPEPEPIEEVIGIGSRVDDEKIRLRKQELMRFHNRRQTLKNKIRTTIKKRNWKLLDLVREDLYRIEGIIAEREKAFKEIGVEPYGEFEQQRIRTASEECQTEWDETVEITTRERDDDEDEIIPIMEEI